SASAARTMNQNDEDKIIYKYGADIIMQTFWRSDAPAQAPAGMPMPGGAPAPAVEMPTSRVQYVEPDYDSIVRDLPGVVHTAKVFTNPDALVSGTVYKSEAKLIDIVPDVIVNTVQLK